MRENQDISELKIEIVFSEDCYTEFKEYCRYSNIVLISELEPVDFVAFRSKYEVTSDIVKEMKDKVNQVKSGIYRFVESKEENTNNRITIGDTDKTESKSFQKGKPDTDKNNEIVTDDNEIYFDDGLCINNVYHENIFNNFRQFCEDNKIIHIKDLNGFEFNKLMEIRGFGVTRVEKIINKYNETISKNIIDNNITNENQRLLISEKMRSRILQLIKLDDSLEMENEFTEEELNILDKISLAIEAIGVETCQTAYLNPQNINIMVDALQGFSNDIITQLDRIEKLNFLFKNINESNKYKKVYPLVKAYSSDSEKNKILIDALSNCSDVVELLGELRNISKNVIGYVEVTKFMEWLQIDLKEWILDSYLEVFKKDDYKEIINCRATGGTLEAAGQLIGVTRERVRQIEKTIQQKFDFRNNRNRFMWIISAFVDGKTIIDKKELIAFLGENEFVYLLMKSHSTYYSYIDDLKVFIVGEQVEEGKLKEFIDKLSDIIFLEDINNIIKNIVEQFKITPELAKKALEDEYKLSGQVYNKRKMSLTEMYGIVLEKYYPTGAKLFDKVEQERFRRYVIEMFGNVQISLNNRALDSRVMDVGVLCDRGTYIHPKYIKIDSELLEEIRDYIKNGERTSYAFLEIFEYFKEKLLLNSNINNRYFLQGTLKHFYRTEFYFTRDMISTSSEIECIYNRIEEFVHKNDVVNKEQLRNEFQGITEAMLFCAIGRCKEIILIEQGEYIHAEQLNIIKDDNEISKIIDSLIVEMPISSRKLLEIMYKTNIDFLNRNCIFAHTKLFSIIQYMFRDKYKFSRPFIAKKDAEDITNIGVVRNYLKDRDSYEISELIEFCEENHIKFVSWTTLIDELSDEFIRADKYLCIRIEKIDISEEKIDIIKNIMKDIISQKGYISARKINDFIFFPNIGMRWNGYILKSIIEKYIPEIKVLQITTSDTFLLSAVFLNDDCEYDSYEELIRSIVKSEHDFTPFNDINEVKQWLQEEELINQNIPKFMFDKNYLYVDEFSKIIVE